MQTFVPCAKLRSPFLRLSTQIMTYDLRERKQNAVYVDSDSDSDTYSDPDYSRMQPRRQQTRGPAKSPYANPKPGQGVQMTNFSGAAGSGRDMVGIRRPVRKSYGRCPRNAVPPIQGKNI